VTERDQDREGVPDCIDLCPVDRRKTAPGLCGCNVSDYDADGDGIPYCEDGCALDATKSAPGACGCGAVDMDSDGDGRADCVDNCPSRANANQSDLDEDGIGDACDDDTEVVPPSFTWPVEGQVLIQPIYSVLGEVLVGDRVEIFDHGDLVAQAVVSSHAFTAILDLPLGDGPHVLQAIALAGSFSSDASAPMLFQVDSGPMAAPEILYPSAGTRIVDANIFVYGRSEPSSALSLWVDGEQLAGAETDEEGRFGVTLSVMANGEHVLWAFAKRTGDDEMSPRSAEVRFSYEPVSVATPVPGDRGFVQMVGLKVAPGTYEPSTPITTTITLTDMVPGRRLSGLDWALINQSFFDVDSGQIVGRVAAAEPLARSHRDGIVAVTVSYSGPVPQETAVLLVVSTFYVGIECPGSACDALPHVGDVQVLPNGTRLLVKDSGVDPFVIPTRDDLLHVNRVDEELTRDANAVFDHEPPKSGDRELFPVHVAGGNTRVFDLFDPDTQAAYIACVAGLGFPDCTLPTDGSDPTDTCEWLKRPDNPEIQRECVVNNNAAWVLVLIGRQIASLAELDSVQVLPNRQLPTRPRQLRSSPIPHAPFYRFMRELGLKEPHPSDPNPSYRYQADVETRLLKRGLETIVPYDFPESAAFVLFYVKDQAEPEGRRLRLNFERLRRQDLSRIGLYVARNGDATALSARYPDHGKDEQSVVQHPRSVQGAMNKAYWLAPRSMALFKGWPVGKPWLYDNDDHVSHECLFTASDFTKNVNSLSYDKERQFFLTGKYVYRKEYPSATDPFDRCTGVSVYDAGLRAAIEAYRDVGAVDPQLFNYLKDPFGRGEGPAFFIGPSVETFVSMPGVIGGSDTAGFDIVGIEPRTQLWAFPKRVIDEMVKHVGPVFTSHYHHYFQNYYWWGASLEHLYKLDDTAMCANGLIPLTTAPSEDQCELLGIPAGLGRWLNTDCIDNVCNALASFLANPILPWPLERYSTVLLACEAAMPDTPRLCFREVPEGEREEVPCLSGSEPESTVEPPNVCYNGNYNPDRPGENTVACPRDWEWWNSRLHACTMAANTLKCAIFRQIGITYDLSQPPQGDLSCDSPASIDDVMNCAVPRNHLGTTAFSYSNILNSSLAFYDKPARCHRPQAWREGQLATTPDAVDKVVMDRLQALDPTFVFAGTGGMHALPAAIKTRPALLDWGVFEQDSSEVLWKFRDAETAPDLAGGVAMSVPPLSSLAFFDDRTPLDTRNECSGFEQDIVGRVAFFRRVYTGERRFGSHGGCIPEKVLDLKEQATLNSYQAAFNAKLKRLAEQDHFAFVDLDALFACVDVLYRLETGDFGNQRQSDLENARQITYHCDQVYRRSNGSLVDINEFRLLRRSGRTAVVAPIIPEAEPNQPTFDAGIFGLDGIHPNRFGHAMIAKAVIDALNYYYGLELPEGGSFSGDSSNGIWLYNEALEDTLIVDPVPIKDQLNIADAWRKRLDGDDQLTLGPVLDFVDFVLGVSFPIQWGFEQFIDGDPDYGFRQAIGDRYATPECLPRNTLIELGVIDPGRPLEDQRIPIDPCSLCCEGAQIGDETARCWGHEQSGVCPRLVPKLGERDEHLDLMVCPD